ncbi:MAG: hypothetical protein HC945_03520 [Nitrosarchaeum sp.]|nr:hypothetical protein [Nitrosarchaeum sp.]
MAGRLQIKDKELNRPEEFFHLRDGTDLKSLRALADHIRSTPATGIRPPRQATQQRLRQLGRTLLRREKAR